MKKLSVMILLVTGVLAMLWAGDALAASDAENEIVRIIERVLDIIVEFLLAIFNGIADAIKSVWTPEK